MKSVFKHIKDLVLLLSIALLSYSSYAQCSDLGEVLDADASGGCGLLIQSAVSGTIYQPIGGNHDLTPGQMVYFSADPASTSDPCPIAEPVIINCLEEVTDPGNPLECRASFIYGYLGENKVVFYNNSFNFNSYEWDFGDGNPASNGNGPVIIHAFDAENVTVCLHIWGEDDCEDEVCRVISPDAPEEMCNISECVWPGDANGDGNANQYDLLNIGLGYGQAGPSRPFAPYPDDPMAWVPNFSQDWPQWNGAINYKHADCDGNGIIRDEDVDAIITNYKTDPDFQTFPVDGAPKVYLEFEEDVIVIDQSSPDYIVLHAKLMVGSADNPVPDLHGIAFDFTYPTNLVLPGAVSLNYDQNSFLGNDVLSLQRDDYNIGRFDQAISRKGGNGITGFGEVATLGFVVSSDIIDGIAEPEITFDVLFDNVVMVDHSGNELDFDLNGGGSNPVFINGGTAGIRPTLEQAVNVFPNPASEVIYVELHDYEGQQLTIYNNLGKQVMTAPLPDQLNKIALPSLPAGLYHFKVTTERGEVSRRILLE